MRLFIIDDESKTRSGLTRHLDWESLGIDLVQTASGAEEAFLLCRQLQPDIILSDIRMRGINGIEMCRTLREIYPDIGIIFISGYADKEYLKAAIELGAVYYVEKPVKTEELEKAIKKAVFTVKKNRQNQNNQDFLIKNTAANKRMLFLGLLEKQEPDSCLRQELYSSGLLPQNSQSMRLLILQMSGPVLTMGRFWELFDQSLQRLCQDAAKTVAYREFSDNTAMLILLTGTRERLSDYGCTLTAFTKTAATAIDAVQMFLSAGEVVDDPFLLYQSYHSAAEGQKSLFYLGYGKTVLHPEKSVPPRMDQSRSEAFRDAVNRGDEAAAAGLLKGLSTEIVKHRWSLNEPLRNFYFGLDREISLHYQRLFQNAGEEDRRRYSDFQKLESIRTAEEMHAHLLERLHHLLDDSKKEEGNNNIITFVIRTIHKNYGNKDLSVKCLAKEVYLTPTYLSSLFKRKTGKTIGEYLTGVRIEKAREILADKQYKLYHIAGICGYEDPNYFAKIFKKQTGLTPSEFRERIL